MKKLSFLLLLCFAGLFLRAASRGNIYTETFGRCAFMQNEKNVSLMAHVFNDSAKPVKDLTLTFSADWQKTVTVKIPAVDAKKWKQVAFPVETNLVPQPYKGTLTLKDAQGKLIHQYPFVLHIAKPYPEQMPVDVAWVSEPEIYREMGFTATGEWLFLNLLKSGGNDPRKEIKVINKTSRMLDQRLVEGFQVLDVLFPRFSYGKFQPFTGRDQKRSVNPGKNEFDPTHRPNWNNLLPNVEKTARYFSSHPAVASVVINSELRDHTRPSFTEYNKKAFRKFSGKDIPSSVDGKTPDHYDNLPDFPLNRVIPEDLDLYQYYLWFWRDGDGWNDLHRAMHSFYAKYAHRNFRTRFEPAVRCPPNWGSGAGLHQVAHWTYVNEYPQAINTNTAELLAMAGGSPGQEIYPSIQVITYGSAVAPRNSRKVTNPPAWMKKFPKCVYPTLAPNLMEESLFLMLSRRTPGGFYLTAASSIYPEKKFASKVRYCTNDQTRDALKKVDRLLIKPFGPLLMRLPERKARVALYQGFASALFAGRASWGWYNWSFHLGNILSKANIHYDVIYDEHILRGDLAKYEAVLLPHADLLTARVLDALQSFQKKGGILLGDATTCPALLPDGEMEIFTNPANLTADEKQQTMRRIGKAIRDQLAALGYSSYAGTDNGDIFIFVRTSNEVDYIFAVNDKRTFGDYVGMFKLCMDKALPNKGEIFVRRKAGVVYELIRHRNEPFTVKNRMTSFHAEFQGNGGQIFVLMPEKLGKVILSLKKKSVDKGGKVALEGKVLYASGKPVSAMLPVYLEVRDAAGNLTGDTTQSTLQGTFRKELVIPLNAPAGTWNVTLRETVSNKSVSAVFTVK